MSEGSVQPAFEEGLESDVRVGSALVHVYAESGSFDDARQVFDKMKEPNVITWTTMFRAYAERGRGVMHTNFIFN